MEVRGVGSAYRQQLRGAVLDQLLTSVGGRAAGLDQQARHLQGLSRSYTALDRLPVQTQLPHRHGCGRYQSDDNVINV